MSDKHTPRPWYFDVSSRAIGPRSTEDDQSYGMILPVAHVEFTYPEDFTHTGLLLAAAPELLEALKSAADTYDALLSDGYIAYAEKARTARELIARIKG